jgi:crotonobetainyl-CoA:carnitine CoA-transferase CaiB-like acyl-CoA transferase
MMDPYRPLEGFRIVDMSSVVMGPLGTEILADLGAQVVAVERPEGDPNRAMGAGPHPDLSGQALNLMRGKRSIVLDIGHPDGREVLERLVAASDVFITNLRPASRRRARVRDEDLRTLRPDLVYCAATGFASYDPRADDPAYDDIIQAASGMVDVHRRAGLGDTYSPTVLADKVCGMVIAHAVTSALLGRERSGLGSTLSIAMEEVLAGFLLVEHGAAAIPDPPLAPAGNLRMLNAARRPLATRDGLVGVLVYERHQFENLVRLIGRHELIGEERFATRTGRLENAGEIYNLCQEWASGFTTEELLALCRTADIPCHRVQTLDEIVASLPLHEHPHAGQYRRTPSLAAGRPALASHATPAPLIGEHTIELLSELGFSSHQTEALLASRAVGTSGPPAGPRER